MRVAVFILGILNVLDGILLLIKPQIYNKVVSFFARRQFMYIPSLVKIIVGAFMLIAATKCDHQAIIIILGIITAGWGITMLGLNKESLKKMYEWWAVRPVIVVRFLSILIIAVGALIIYAAGMPE